MEIVAGEFRYADREVALTGFLVRPAEVSGQPAPGLLLVHGGAGLDDHARSQARRYAALGYVVLACDMFGPGVGAKILVCHGACDPHVPLKDVTAFIDEMQQAEADWQLIVYGNAVHGFTHTDAVPGAVPGGAYDAAADRRSFQAACDFLAELLPRPATSASNQPNNDNS
jgi:dienelactone hydrolase